MFVCKREKKKICSKCQLYKYFSFPNTVKDVTSNVCKNKLWIVMFSNQENILYIRKFNCKKAFKGISFHFLLRYELYNCCTNSYLEQTNLRTSDFVCILSLSTPACNS